MQDKPLLYAGLTIICGCLLGTACAEPQCPDGFTKLGHVCKRNDAGTVPLTDGVMADDGPDASSADGSSAAIDSARPVDADQGADAPEQNCTGAVCRAAPECDQGRSCSTGYICSDGQCVSACAQHSCPANSTCSLAGGNPTCSCGTGFVLVPEASGSPARCAADLACAQLGCDANATCEMGSDNLRRCVCKAGYAGSGTSCTPVSCDSPPNPADGSVAAVTGRTFEQWAEYTCNPGFALSGGTMRRQCQSTGMWSGTAPACVLACQATNDCRPGIACLDNADCGAGNTCEGSVCLAASCPGGSVSNVANLAEKKFCKEINGDLSIPMDSLSLAQIEFPYLTRVLGHIEITRPVEFSAKRTVTFNALTRVDGFVRMVEDTRGSTELRFPRLERVDGAVSFTQINSINLLDLSALTTTGELHFEYIYNAMDLKLDAIRTVASMMIVMSVPWIGYRPIFARLADPAQVAVGNGGRLIIQVGCSVSGNGSPDCPSN